MGFVLRSALCAGQCALNPTSRAICPQTLPLASKDQPQELHAEEEDAEGECHVSSPWFEAIAAGSKTVEGRLHRGTG